MHGKARDIQRFLLWTALYFVGAVLSQRYLSSPEGSSMLWPSAGVGFAVAVRYGLRWSAVVAVGTLLFMLTPPAASGLHLVLTVVAKTAATLIAAWYVLRGRTLHLRTDDGMRLLGGGVLQSVLGAAFGVFVLLQTGRMDAAVVPEAFVRWVLGDMLGIAVVAPTILLCTTTRNQHHQLSPLHENSKLRERMFWIALLGTSFIAIHSLGGRGIYVLGLISLPLVLLLWSALRFSPVWTSAATGITVIYLGVATGMGLAGFVAPRTLLETTVLLLLLCLIAVIPVMMALAGLEQRTTSYALYQRATRDTLTGLLNRTAFEEEARKRLGANDFPATLLYLDLDNLKIINDSTSHVAGDDMIHAIGGVIAAAVGNDALVSRTGGDEFAILLPRGEAGAIVEARRLLNEIEAMRLPWRDQVLTTTASIGLVSATAHADGRDYDSLFSHADAACFAAKELGGNRFHVSYPTSDEAQAHSAVMRSALRIREVLEREQFLLYVQPIVPTRKVQRDGVHFEVLLRWQEPGGRIHVPAEFISAAERFRMGPRIDRYVIDAALRWLERNPHAAKGVASCGINLSGATLTDEHFADYLAARLRRSSFPAENLCLEITETSVVRDRQRAQRFIGQMRDLGCRFALDDFGTGFCSFGYLSDLDVDYIKIDGSFIRGLENSQLSQAVVRSIGDIAHVIGKSTIAEQVETEAEHQLLKEMQVDYAQGYLFGRPQSIDTFFTTPAVA
ncbi:putative bifunctional diguanylate cyclase/phosphodiesterase [Lysobacter solisilvae (ex Woo and Kim 2020)]|uniref:EAL domain-containing protein n=1 Tax=Agrilutibacter terrestris TaxID=2865112 RepID=A0A7H0FYU4_9GAMM|nr:EAL domain-containing protein [Lysobacter terrestris]QNP41210.1 EAL domain-containing protein [Lysobacter terrestris]